MTDSEATSDRVAGNPARANRLEPWLRDILVCPACRSELRDDTETAELVCTGTDCGLAYPVVDGIPVLLVDDARPTLGRASEPLST